VDCEPLALQLPSLADALIRPKGLPRRRRHPKSPARRARVRVAGDTSQAAKHKAKAMLGW